MGKTVLVGVALSISLVFLTMCGNHTITSKDINDIAKEENLAVIKDKTTDKHLVSRLSIDGTKKGLPKVLLVHLIVSRMQIVITTQLKQYCRGESLKIVRMQLLMKKNGVMEQRLFIMAIKKRIIMIMQ